LGGLAQLAASAALHLTLVVIAVWVTTTVAPDNQIGRTGPRIDQEVRHVVLVAPELPRLGGGGGGGGNQQSGPIRRAQAVGSDTITRRVRKPLAMPTTLPAVEEAPSIPSIVLDATPLASGSFEQIGLPISDILTGTSTGPGSGGGVGSGVGTGVGSGRGPGLGPGSGGGTEGRLLLPRSGGGVSSS